MTITVRYYGSLAEHYGQIGCATLEGEWTGRDTSRYTVRLWDGSGTLRHVRATSIESGSVTVWHDSPCICRCGEGHDRTQS